MHPATGRDYDPPTVGRETRVRTTAPGAPAMTRFPSGDYASATATATVDVGEGTISGSLAVLVPMGASRALRRFRIAGTLAWDNTGSTGFRCGATTEGGGTARVTLVFSGRGALHLRVELFHLQEVCSADPAAPVSDRHVFELDRGDGSTVITATGAATLTAGIAAGEPYPDLDVLLEQIAHNFMYRPALDAASIETLRQWGWSVVPHGRLVADLQMMLLRPVPGHPEPRQPVLAFRGTEPLSAADWLDDLAAPGVGRNQFARNDAEILRSLGSLGGNVTVTGHSLGGALAQLCAAMYPAHVGRVVTFQAPGISAELVDQMRASAAGRRIESRHHVVADCVVSGAGEAHTPGRVFTHHGERGIPVLDPHTSMPLAEETEAVLPAGAGFSEAPRRTYPSVTEGTADPSNGVFEAARTGLGRELGAATMERARYVREWDELRARAMAGDTRVHELRALIAAAAEPHRADLTRNLDAMFPELVAAGDAEPAVHDGTIYTEQAFLDAVEETTGRLDGVQRDRVRRYFRILPVPDAHRHDMAR